MKNVGNSIAADRLQAARAFNWLVRSLPRGSRIVMRGLREESDALAVVRAYAPDLAVPETTCLHADLDESYFSTRSRSLRKGISRSRRKNGVEVKRIDADIVEVFLVLNRERFGESSRFSDPAGESFIREALPPLIRAGSIEPYAVLRGSEILAVDLALVTRDALASWNGGFTAEAARLAPGRLLFAAEIERALADGKSRFDLLRGSHPYKRSWATGSHQLYRAEVVA